MNTTHMPSLPSGLESRIQQLIDTEDLGSQRAQVQSLSEKSGVDVLDCAAALLFLLQNPAHTQGPESVQPSSIQRVGGFRQALPQKIKMVRYRLDVGHQHHVTVEELKKVLIEESGVDHKNIANIDIQDSYTLIELPDEMPPDIFQHLKSVEINRQRLDIRRVKNRRAKKRGSPRYGRHRQPTAKATETA